ncbi:MAG: hypothetical protein ACOCT9_01765 [archaeon]
MSEEKQKELYNDLTMLIHKIAKYTIKSNPTSCPEGGVVCWDNDNKKFIVAPQHTENWGELIEKGYIPLTQLEEYHFDDEIKQFYKNQNITL